MRWFCAPALGLLFLPGCSPRIRDYHLEDRELVEQAPIIVVGRVERREMFMKESRRHGTQDTVEGGRVPLYWFHVRVVTTMENVLRGDVAGPAIEYIYWLPAAPVVGHWNSLIEGARYVHFLRRDGNQLRALVDFWPSAIRVTSGRHYSVPQGSGVPNAIARLLLEPGQDFVAHRFDISEGAGYSIELAGLKPTLVMVEALAHNPDTDIRAEACEVLRAYGDADVDRRCK